MGPRRNSDAGRAVPGSSLLCPAPDRPEGLEHGGHVPGRGRLTARDADVVLVDQTEQHAPCARLGHDGGGPPRRPHDDRVEELPMEQVEARPLQAVGQLDRPAVDPPGDAPQSLRAVVHRVHGGDDRQEDLRGADVRCRLLPADVLLACLERQPVGGPLLRVDRQPDQSSREIPLEARLHRHERCVRPSVPEWNAETLRRPDHDVGPPLPRRLEEGQCQEVGGHRHQRATGVGLLGQRRRGPGWRPNNPGTAARRRRIPRRGGRRRDRPRRPRSRAARAESPARQGSAGGSRRRRAPDVPRPSARRRISVTASATAVLSSSSDALAVSSPLRSDTIVWKFSKASRRPWLISGWYGV